MSQEAGTLTFSVSDLSIDTLEGFLVAAELHLGVENAKSIEIAQPNPMEAWLALKSAGALMDQFSPVMSEDFRVPLYARLTFLIERFEELLPSAPATPKMPPVASLKGVVEEALNALHAPAASVVSAPEAPKLPTIPGTGLPKRGSGLLFPPRGR
jgi:hypothetical protein